MTVPSQFPGSRHTFSHTIPDEEILESNAHLYIPVRRSNAYRAADEIIDDLGRAWAANIGSGQDSKYSGSKNTIFGCFDALILPESQPIRFELAVWFTEFFFLCDDWSETLSQDAAHTQLNPTLSAILGDEGKKDPQTALEALLVPQVRRLFAMDPVRARRVVETWQYWLQHVDSKGPDHFKTLDEYEEFRVINCGMLPYSQMMEYTMELSLTEIERQQAKKLEALAFRCIGISNDLWSWPKEVQAYKQGNRLMNAILIVMKTRNLQVHQAISIVKARVIQYQQALLAMREELLSATSVSEDMRRFVDGYMYIVSGNELWQAACRRYHPELYLDL